MKDKKEIMKLRKIIKISAIVAMSLSLSTLNAASNHIGYQGIAFDDGSALVEQSISLRFTVYQDNGSTVVYQETKTGIKTTDKGFFSHKIGSGVKSSSSPLWSNVAWNDNYKLKVEIDKNNGTSFVNLGTQDLISVAYAKKSENASSATTLSGLTSSVTELNHVDGVSSNIQTQLDGKMKKGFTNNPQNNFQVALVKANGELTYHTTIESTELSHLNNVSSNIQSQLDNKLPSTGNASTATKLQTARKIGGVSFDGSSDINLPGVNTAGTQNTSGNSATATKLKTARTLNGKSFDGSADVTLIDPYISAENTTNASRYLTFSASSTAGYKRIRTDENLQYNPSTNTLTASVFSGSLSGNASSATTLSGLTSTVAELNYMGGVTSNIQTQLDAKLSPNANIELGAGKFIQNGTDSFGWLSNDNFRVYLDSTKSYFATKTGKVIINDSSNDVDFIVESNGNENMIFVDGANNRVGVGTNSLAHTFTVDGKAKITDDLYVTDYIGAGRLNIGGTTVTDVHDEDDMTSNSASALATQQSIKAYVDSAVSGVDTSALLPKSGGTMTGRLLFDRQTYIGNDTDSKKVDLFGWREDNQFRVYLNNNNIYLSTELGALIVNESGDIADIDSAIDFRVESKDKNHMIFSDASANRVGIGKKSSNNNTPPTLSYTLDVDGTVGVSSALSANGGIKLGAGDFISYSSDADDYFGWYSDDKFRVFVNDEKYLATEAGELVVNDNGDDSVANSAIDFRVESKDKNHMIFSDASANRVGIGKKSSGDTPPTLSYTLDVNGTLGVSGQITAGSMNIGGTTVTDVHDEDDMSSNSASALATQQSIKKYVDTKVSKKTSISSSSSSSLVTEGAVKSYVDSKTSSIPAGSIMAFAGSTAPTGWLLCDGRSISSTTYRNLYNVIRTTYGGTSSYFRLPNLNGKNIIGKSSSGTFGSLGNSGGAKEHTLTINQIPPHNHSFAGATGDEDGAGSKYVVSGNKYKSSEHYRNVTLGMNSTGGGEAHNILDPYIVLNYIIKY